MKQVWACGASAIAVAAALWAQPGYAAGEAGGAGSNGSDGVVIDELIITATRRAENLQDVPIAVTAIGEEALKALGAEATRNLSAPNFLFPTSYTNTRSYISVRGVFQEVPNIAFDSGFSVYVDGVYMGRNMSNNVDTGGIERVEILRGPQGTLWGKNTIAGLMNIVSKKPGDNFEGNLEAQRGNLDLVRVRADVNVPIVEGVLAARLSAHSARRDGYVHNLAAPGENSSNRGAGIHEDTGRLQVLFTPNDQLSVRLSADTITSHNTGYSYEDTTPGAGGGDTIRYTYSGNVIPKERRADRGASLTAEYGFANGFALTSITGYRKSKSQWVEDDDGSPYELVTGDFRDQQEFVSQEVRLSTPTDRRYDAVLGLYYFDQRAKSDFRIPLGVPFGGPFTVRYNDVIDSTSYAVFTHANFHATEALNLFGGIRYTHESKDFLGSRIIAPGIYTNPAYILPPVTSPPTQPMRASISVDNVSGTVGAQYHFSRQVMAYASFANGFKSGGFDLATAVVVKPEYLTSYELGAKSSLFEDRVTLNVATFYSEYKDLQVRDLVLGPPITSVLRNAANVTAKGIELELTARPIDELVLSLGVGYVDSTFKKYRTRSTFGLPIDAAGNHLPMTPPWTINGSVHYERPLANGATLVTHGDFTWVDDRYSVLDAGQNGPGFALNSYGVINGRLGYKSADDRWELYAWGKNLANSHYAIDRRPSPSGVAPPNGPGTIQFETYAEPRTYGVTLDVNF